MNTWLISRLNLIVCISVVPQSCLHNCTCHRSPLDGANIFDCQNKGLTSLPETVFINTDWLLLSGNNLGSLQKPMDYFINISVLNLSLSQVISVDQIVMEAILKNVQQLDLRGNKLKILPKSIMKAHKTTKLWLSENPFECNCDMLWIRDWLLNTGNIMDIENTNCSLRTGEGNVF